MYLFLAVQNSLIGDLVTNSLTHSGCFYFLMYGAQCGVCQVAHTCLCICVCVIVCVCRTHMYVHNVVCVKWHTHMCTTLCTIHGGGKVYPKIEGPGLPDACITTTANSGGVVSAMTGSV